MIDKDPWEMIDKEPWKMTDKEHWMVDDRQGTLLQYHVHQAVMQGKHGILNESQLRLLRPVLVKLINRKVVTEAEKKVVMRMGLTWSNVKLNANEMLKDLDHEFAKPLPLDSLSVSEKDIEIEVDTRKKMLYLNVGEDPVICNVKFRLHAVMEKHNTFAASYRMMKDIESEVENEVALKKKTDPTAKMPKLRLIFTDKDENKKHLAEV
ncbi:hypothetical protein DdX_03407 [Ditylenchus destructor]|uniref:Uncharacterized protein n=1 Tax=Ditylenchus destructor TaxID=166010 RepID=A0AAD4N8Q3_9BILA|nr:hypothetical protein DdX_03407 [Ditylenchus destructor]